jgi:hypothetical protein
VSKYLRYGIIEDLDTVRHIPYGTFWGVKLSGTPLTWLSPFVFFGLRLALSLLGPNLSLTGRLFDAFVDAARTGADLLSVHMTTGYPHELVPGRGPSPLGIQQVIELRKAHSDAWAAADAGRNRFELAAFAVELVATTSSAEAIADLRAFLDETLYSGLPWGFVKHGARVPINPVDIVPAALTRARPWVERSARELWGRDVPTSHAQPSPKPSSSSAAAS